MQSKKECVQKRRKWKKNGILSKTKEKFCYEIVIGFGKMLIF
jgi:hypothetical protein